MTGAPHEGPEHSVPERTKQRGAVGSRRRFLASGVVMSVGALAGCVVRSPFATSERLDEPTAASRQLPTRPETIFQSDVERTGYWPDESVPTGVTLEWVEPGINSGPHTAAKSSPLYHAGDVFVPADTGTLYSFTPDGQLNWQSTLVHSSRGTHGTPAIVDTSLFIAGYDGAVYAFDTRSGERIWRRKVADAIGSSPVYYDGMVIVATEFYNPSGGIVALDATTGETLWRDNRIGGQAHSITGIDPEANRFAAGSNDGTLYVWRLDDGDFVGSFETGGPIKGPVCMVDGTAIFGSWGGTLYAVDTETVSEEWHYETGSKIMSGPAVHPDSSAVVFGTHGDNAHTLDVATGEHRWTYETDGWIIGAITIAGDTALFGSYDTSVYAVDVPSGRLRWRVTEPQGRVSTAPAVVDDDIYITERAAFGEDEQLETPGALYKLTAD